MTLRSLRFPGQGLLVWSDPTWLQHILPADSRKKKLLRSLVSLPGFSLLSRRFDGKLLFDGRVYDLDDLLAQLSDIVPVPTVSAIFVNGRRNPPRIYVWLESEGNPLFLKIGNATERPVFENEVKALTGLNPDNDLLVMRPMALRFSDALVLLLSQGMSPTMHRQKRRLSPDEVLAYFGRLGLQANGFFGGPVHGDLASHNVFDLGNKLLIVDWEFGAPSGPDYCDLIEIGAALVVADPNECVDLDALKTHLHKSAEVQLDDSTLRDALAFLAERGNINARTVLSATGPSREGRP